MVVVVMISPRAPSLLFHVPIKALHSGYRLPLQAGYTAEGKAYVCSYNFSRVEEYQQWLRAVVEHIYSLPSRLVGERGHRTRSAYNPRWCASLRVCPVGVKSYLQA
jgi:hypothetical protein